MDVVRKKRRVLSDTPPTANTLQEFQETFPKYEFRIQKEQIQRKFKYTWKSVCTHNRVKSECVLCGGSRICEHKKIKTECKSCKGSGVCEHDMKRGYCRICTPILACIHGRRKNFCKPCGGNTFCTHGKRKESCITCDGRQICPHKKLYYLCHECDGRALCEHQKIKSQCRDCGGSAFCEHGTVKYNCIPCGGCNVCPQCKDTLIVKDGLCTTCHPDYIPRVPGTSKMACRYMDELQRELDCPIQHKHYDKFTKKIVGTEFRPGDWFNKGVDGFIAPNTVIEFFGDYYHGHPLVTNHVSPNMFANTEAKMIKLASLGFEIKYVWEFDYTKRGEFGTHASLLRTFNGKLEWE